MQVGDTAPDVTLPDDDDGVIREVWRKVKVPGHAEAVLAAARAL